MTKKKIRAGIFCSMPILLLISCTQGYDDSVPLDLSDVNNTQMISPPDSVITRLESKDGKRMTLQWPFSFGAGGYEILYATLDVDDEVDQVIYDYPAYDGNSITVPIMEDTRYVFSIKTLGNKQYNNTDADTATRITFGTAYKLIRHFMPGDDVTAYFDENPVPQVDYPIEYTFEPGGTYTISKNVSFGLSSVMLRAIVPETVDESEPFIRPIITMAGAGFVSDGAGVKFKNLSFSYSGTPTFLSFKNSLTDHPKLDNSWVTVLDPIVFQSCDIDLNIRLLYDGGQKYALKTVYFKDCVLSFNNTGTFLDFSRNGIIKDLVFENSTVWSKNAKHGNYFIRYGTNRISANTKWTWSLSQSIEFNGCTFYQVSKTGQFFNGNGWNTTSGGIKNWLIVKNTIFVDCGKKEVIRRLRVSNNVGIECDRNTYWYDGSFVTGEIATNWDASGTSIQNNPDMADPVNGDFHVHGPQRGLTGDPRWW